MYKLKKQDINLNSVTMSNFVLLHGKLWKRRQKQNELQDLGLRQRVAQDMNES